MLTATYDLPVRICYEQSFTSTLVAFNPTHFSTRNRCYRTP